MSESLRREIPRVLAEQLSHRAKDAAFDEHASVEFVISVQSREPLNGQSVQHDAVLFWNDRPASKPARAFFGNGKRRNFYAHVREICRPELFEVLCGGGDGGFKNCGPRAQ